MAKATLAKSSIVLVTSGVYWSMLEVGLGLISANLVVLYGLLVSQSKKGVSRIPRLTPGMFTLPSGHFKSDTEQGTRHSDERKMWNGPSVGVASFAEFARAESPTNEVGMDLHEIHVSQTLNQIGNVV